MRERNRRGEESARRDDPRPFAGVGPWPGILLTAVLAMTSLPAAPAIAQEPSVRTSGDSVYLNFRALDVSTALESISQVLGINYVLAGDPQGTLTMRTRSGIPRERVPAVLETLLRTQDLRVRRDGDLFVVSPVQEGAAEGGPEQEIFVYPLRNANAVEMANLLVTLFGGETGRFQREQGLGEEGALSDQLRGLRLPAGVTGIDRGASLEQGARGEAGRRTEAGRGTASAELIGGLTVVPDERTNAVVVRTAPENYPSLRRTLEELDQRPLQVLIEVVIAEVTLDESSRFGVDFRAFFGGDPSGEVRGGNLGDFPAPDTAGLFTSVFDPDRVTAVFRALASENRLNVLSTPRILASNNEEASILIGSEVPFAQISSFGGVSDRVVQSVQFRDVGLQLEVVPRVNAAREVSLEVRQQNSSLSSTSFGNLDAPTITTREAETSLVVGDGRTVVLGGLIETQRQRRESGIPVLMEIPLLGNVFRSLERVTTKRELIITLTPYIVASDEEAEELRRRLQERNQWLEDRLEGLQGGAGGSSAADSARAGAAEGGAIDDPGGREDEDRKGDGGGP